MYILGISAYYHDSAACLVQDGEIVAAAQEERFTRKKHDPGFPRRAVEYCLVHRPSLIASIVFAFLSGASGTHVDEARLPWQARELRGGRGAQGVAAWSVSHSII